MNFQHAIEEMNGFWLQPRSFTNIHAQHIWNRVRVTVCYNPMAAHGMFEKQPIIDPGQRLNFLTQLETNLQCVGVKDSLKKVNNVVDTTINQTFHCVEDLQREILKMSLFESSIANADIRAPRIWSTDTVNACTQWMHMCGFREITRTASAQEGVVGEVVPQLMFDCAHLIEKTNIDPYVLGMGANVSLEILKDSIFGSASPYGTITLEMYDIHDKNMSTVFFHEWFHMLDFAAFYAVQNPEVCSPLEELDAPLRALHKSLIRMDVNKFPSLDPYNNLMTLIEIWGQELGHTPQQKLEHIRQMKEVFHRDKNNRRENLNTFFHTVVLENQSGADLYRFIDNGLETFDIISAGIKGFHKYLQQGYSEFYSLSMQMDDNHYHTQRKPLKWYQKRKPYYSKPCEVLARSAEQFCAKKLGWVPSSQLEYPQRQEARRVYELFEGFFNTLSTVKLSSTHCVKRQLQ